MGAPTIGRRGLCWASSCTSRKTHLRTLCCLSIGLVLLSSWPARADWWPDGWYEDAAPQPGQYPDMEKMKVPFYWDTAEPATVFSIAFVRFYQTALSRTRSGNCPFWPSCSRYGLRALHDYGAFFGWIMILDRMFFRENIHMYSDYPRVLRGRESYPYDPPAFDYLLKPVPLPLVREDSAYAW